MGSRTIINQSHYQRHPLKALPSDESIRLDVSHNPLWQQLRKALPLKVLATMCLHLLLPF